MITAVKSWKERQEPIDKFHVHVVLSFRPAKSLAERQKRANKKVRPCQPERFPCILNPSTLGIRANLPRPTIERLLPSRRPSPIVFACYPPRCRVRRQTPLAESHKQPAWQRRENKCQSPAGTDCNSSRSQSLRAVCAKK